MFDRTKLTVNVNDRSYGKDRTAYAYVNYCGTSILVTADYEPGPDLLAVMDKIEVFVRHVQDGAKWETAYLTAFPG